MVGYEATTFGYLQQYEIEKKHAIEAMMANMNATMQINQPTLKQVISIVGNQSAVRGLTEIAAQIFNTMERMRWPNQVYFAKILQQRVARYPELKQRDEPRPNWDKTISVPASYVTPRRLTKMMVDKAKGFTGWQVKRWHQQHPMASASLYVSQQERRMTIFSKETNDMEKVTYKVGLNDGTKSGGTRHNRHWWPGDVAGQGRALWAFEFGFAGKDDYHIKSKLVSTFMSSSVNPGNIMPGSKMKRSGKHRFVVPAYSKSRISDTKVGILWGNQPIGSKKSRKDGRSGFGRPEALSSAEVAQMGQGGNPNRPQFGIIDSFGIAFQQYKANIQLAIQELVHKAEIENSASIARALTIVAQYMASGPTGGERTFFLGTGAGGKSTLATGMLGKGGALSRGIYGNDYMIMTSSVPIGDSVFTRDVLVYHAKDATIDGYEIKAIGDLFLPLQSKVSAKMGVTRSAGMAPGGMPVAGYTDISEAKLQSSVGHETFRGADMQFSLDDMGMKGNMMSGYFIQTDVGLIKDSGMRSLATLRHSQQDFVYTSAYGFK